MTGDTILSKYGIYAASSWAWREAEILTGGTEILVLTCLDLSPSWAGGHVHSLGKAATCCLYPAGAYFVLTRLAPTLS